METAEATNKSVEANTIPAEAVVTDPQPLEVAEPAVEDRESLISDQQGVIEQVGNDLSDVKTRRTNTEQLTTSLLGDLSQQSAYTMALEDQVGLTDLERQLSGINAEMKAEKKLLPATFLQTEQDAIGTGLTTSSLNTRLSNRQRDSAIKQLVLGANADILQGRIDTANSRIDRAIEAKYEPMKAELEIAKFNLERLDSAYSEGKIELTNAQAEKLDLQKGKIAKEEADLEKLQAMQAVILKNQPNKEVRDAVLAAESVKEINNVKGIQEFLLSPVEKLDMKVRESQLATQAMQRSQISANIGKINAQIAAARAEGRQAVGANGQPLDENALKQVQSVSAQLAKVRNMKKDKFLGAGTYLPAIRGSERKDFNLEVDRLKNLLTLENLDLMSGVLSETDIQILQSAGTSLGTNMSASSFDTELSRIEGELAGGLSSTVGNAPQSDTMTVNSNGTITVGGGEQSNQDFFNQ